ncbi:hypothetical protein VP01_790g2 [Puccinia sorghi]|uniref:Signal recognition particle subunit SRP72 n=1 Tax=Puccinia sorghi TaxID=27349 RepID=A0A0L6UCY3_9BASI|nr:hypothetical protein VP01_790g2 [Puccinia sorghi]
MAPKTSRKALPKRSQVKPKAPHRRTRTPEQLAKARRIRLYHQLDGGFHHNALKTCNQLLAQEGTQQDRDTLIDTKAKLLTVLEKYQEALEFVSTQSTGSPGIKMLQCYCFYKLGQLEEADRALSNPLFITQEDLFKLGRPQEAKAHLEELLTNSDPNHPEHLDLTANLSACQARIDFVEDTIPSLTGLINVDSLEAAPITSSFFQSHPNFPPPSRSRLSKSTKPRKVKAAKPLDPSRPPPDPDRWLPRREKEHVKPKKRSAAKNIKTKQKLATQGSISTVLPPAIDPSSQKHKQVQRKKNNRK